MESKIHIKIHIFLSLFYIIRVLIVLYTLKISCSFFPVFSVFVLSLYHLAFFIIDQTLLLCKYTLQA